MANCAVFNRSLRGLILLAAIVAGWAVTAKPASAELTTITGFSFLSNHPTLGNIGMNVPGSAITDDAGLGAAAVGMKINFVGYNTLAATVTVEDTIITFGGGTIQFSFAPATLIPTMFGSIPGGSIFAQITAASDNIAGIDASKFVGGQLAFTYQNAKVQFGTTQAGNSGSVTFPGIASASFTFRVPEPSSVVLGVLSLAGFGLLGLRRQRRSAENATQPAGSC